MAGSPTCGKISTGMRRTARTAHNAMAMSATMTVMGRPRAARTRRIWGTLRSHERERGTQECVRHSFAGLRYEWLDVAGGGSDGQQGAPDTEPGERVVDLGLGK